MATKRTLIMTTTASEADASTFPTVTGIVAVSTEPDGTSVRIVTKVADTWQKYDAATSAWKDVATQSLTAASVASEGNSVAEINAIPASALTGFVGKKVNFAIVYTTTNDAQPSLASITINGETGATVSEETVASNTVTLGSEPVEILSIDVDKTETNGGKADVLASVNTSGDMWTDYTDYSNYVTNPATKALAIRFKYVLSAPTIGSSTAQVNSVTIKHRTDSVAVFTEGTGVCISKTYNFANPISRAHLMVKHPVVDDTEITAYVSLRKPPTYVSGEVLGTGTGKSQTVTLANTDGLASHGFALYFDGDVQDESSYSFSPADGQVTFTAESGVAVTADYIAGWSNETWTPMTHDTIYPDKNDTTLVDDQFDYIASSDSDAKGTVGAIRVDLKQITGVEKNVVLGTGNGKEQAFKLPHHAKQETIEVKPDKATWKYKDKTDVITITAATDEEIFISYKWAARSNYLESLTCIFNE
nr:MAG TPA: protein of unknown function DUF2460 [Caudoviricetes sp.]